MFENIVACISAVVCAIVLTVGARRERIGTLICLSTYGFCLLLDKVWPQSSLWFYLAAHGLCLIGLYPLCWKAPTPWPLWAIGCALLAVMADILALANPQILKSTLIVAINLSSCGQFISLAAGAFTICKARKSRDKSEKLGIFSYD